jgi:hypothetical protein
MWVQQMEDRTAGHPEQRPEIQKLKPGRKAPGPTKQFS